MAFRKRPSDPEAAFVRNIEVTIDGVLDTGSKATRIVFTRRTRLVATEQRWWM